MRNFFTIINLFLLTSILASSTYAQGSLWKKWREGKSARDSERWIVPDEYRALKLDFVDMQAILENAPMEKFNAAQHSHVLLPIPLPDGRTLHFRMVESPIMAKNLASRYPEIKTWAGQGIEDPAASMRCDITPAGFHAIIHTSDGTIYIDPYSVDDTEHYVSYYTRNYPGDRIECLAEDIEAHNHNPSSERSVLSIGSELRVYRLAVAATGAYSTFHGGTTASVLAAITTTINRVNAIYEREFSIRLELVEGNDDILYGVSDPISTGMSDPYTNNNPVDMLAQNRANLNTMIGNANFDIGHVFATSSGGIATYMSVCGSRKAEGVSGSSSPMGDPFMVDIVSHEIAHQFSAHHSFNGVNGSCTTNNRYSATACEPGSGSTIMSYAGICFSDNLQTFVDDYFHVVNFEEIVLYTTQQGGNSCAQVISTGNQAPDITIPEDANIYIPYGTPFELKAHATDPDGDEVTFCWEQIDKGPATALDQPFGNAPIFRSLPPSESSSRIFPKLSSILSNTSSKGEVLPAYERPLSFRLTTRDNRIGGGGVSTAEYNIGVANMGPFEIVQPNTFNDSWNVGEQALIVWDPASTNSSPVNCSEVNIKLSTDGGYTYPITLATAIPNNGIAYVTVPNVSGNLCRVKIEAANNIFFDISDYNFTISGATPIEADLDSEASLLVYPNPAEERITLELAVDKGQEANIRMLNLEGQVVYAKSTGFLPVGTHQVNVDVTTWAAGTYVYVVEGEGFTLKGRIIVE